MKRIVIFATVHQLQQAGHFLNPELAKRLTYLHEKFAFETILEEWSGNKPPSFAAQFARKLNLDWKNVGTPNQKEFWTYTNPVNHPGHDGTLPQDDHAPGLSEYGPFEAQEAREGQMVKNIQEAMASYTGGLFIVGLAHLHSLFGKLRSGGFGVTGYHWLENPMFPK